MKLYPIETGNFKLDGGAMFGVVPKSLWERTNPADARNRIDMAARALLIEDGRRLILIDTGLGNKQSDKFFSHYGLWGDHALDTSLAKAGFHPDEITDVVFTHLHFDHCGGAIIRNEKNRLVPKFKNALFWVHENHWEWATAPNSREKASFLPENIQPLQDSGQLQTIRGGEYFLPDSPIGFGLFLMDGHTEKQILPLIEYQGTKLVFAGDLIPTAGHLPIPYVMGYDTRPLKSLAEKSKFLDEAEQNGYVLFMEHDAHNELLTLKRTEKGVRLERSFTFREFFS